MHFWFLTLTPQLVSFFRSHGCARDLSEDLSQEVMLTVYRKAAQIRDRARFRAWLFTVARHALYRHHGKHALEVVAIDVQDIVDTRTKPMGHSAFEFHHWMNVPGIKRARGADFALCRGMGVPRDRRSKSDSDRDSPVASFQRQEKASHTPEGIWASRKKSSLINQKETHA